MLVQLPPMREHETLTILEDLRRMRADCEPRLLMFVGGSGGGKSSLVKAGVLPRLKHKTPNTEWVVLPTLRHAEHANEQRTIFDQLAVSIAELFPKDAKSTPDWKVLRTELIGDDLEQAVKVSIETLQDLTLALNCSDAAVLIAFDQVEELLVPSAGAMARLSTHLPTSGYSGPRVFSWDRQRPLSPALTENLICASERKKRVGNGRGKFARKR